MKNYTEDGKAVLEKVSVPSEVFRPAFSRILFAADFSAGSDIAFQFAMRAAARLHARLLLFHVFENSDAGSRDEGEPGGLIERRQEEVLRLEKMKQMAIERQLDAECLIADGIAALEIRDAIERQQIDLAILATRAEAGLNRLVLGSTAETVFRGVHCPVLTIGPHAIVDGTVQNGPIIFVTHRDKISVEAAGYAAYISEVTGRLLHCVYVLRPGEEGTLTCAMLLEKLQRALVAGGVHVEDPVCAIRYHDDVAEGVMEYASREGAACIVMGIKPASELAAHLPAQIAYRIIAGAACPVMTVPYKLHR